MTVESRIFRQTPYFLNFTFNGQLYTFHHRFSIPGNATVDAVLAQTGTPKLIHVFQRVMTIQGGGPYVVTLIENPTISDTGTDISSQNSNMDRRSTKTPQLQYFSNPTISGGTVISEDFLTSGGGPNASSSIGGSIVGIERLLALDTDYVLRIQNTGSNQGTFHFDILTYESQN